MRNNLKDMDRPLQKSMIIQQPYPRNQEYSHFHPLKRSSIAYHESTHQNQNSSTSHVQMNNSIPSKQYFDRSPVNFPVNSMTQRPPSHLNQNANIALSQKVDRLLMQMNKHEMMLYEHDKLLKDVKLDDSKCNDSVIQNVVNQIKEQYLPTIVSKTHKQLYQYVFNFKIDLQTIKDQLKNSVNKLTQQNHQNSKSIKDISEALLCKDYINIKKQVTQDIKYHCSILDDKIQQLQRTMAKKDQNWKNLLATKENTVLRSSNIRSSITPIMLKYMESFSIWPENPSLHDSNTEMVITTGLYYVDGQGYLMDNQNRYLLDEKGIQVKLSDKHLQVLKKHKILT